MHRRYTLDLIVEIYFAILWWQNYSMVDLLKRQQTKGKEQYMTRKDSRLMTMRMVMTMTAITVMTSTCITEDNSNSGDITDSLRAKKPC